MPYMVKLKAREVIEMETAGQLKVIKDSSPTGYSNYYHWSQCRQSDVQYTKLIQEYDYVAISGYVNKPAATHFSPHV